MAAGASGSVTGVLAYHERTKHHPHRFAAGPGRLDWATQPDPFRSYAGAPRLSLPCVVPADAEPRTLGAGSIGDLLRCALGLTAWKQAGGSRWALRANPSSGNLHPTEAYVVTGALEPGVWQVCHYDPRDHALEVRARLAGPLPGPPDVALIGLTSIAWREAWRYGERAFRYCQHDAGHAIGALAYAAALQGWRARVLPGWSEPALAALLGVSPGPDPEDGPEREYPECLMAVGPGEVGAMMSVDAAPWAEAARRAAWSGTPNQLSPARVRWAAIDEMAEATASDGEMTPDSPAPVERAGPVVSPVSRRAILRRRSAVAFDGRSALPLAAFQRILAQVTPGATVEGAASPAWPAFGGPALVQLVWFIHRVEGVVPGLYAQLRDAGAEPDLRAGLRDDLLWADVPGVERLRLLAPLDARGLARRLSCDQDIAADGYLALAMLAPLGRALEAGGPSAYRRLFRECGLIGQVLYLEAEVAGGRSTGIGCFYDDAVHQVLGVRDRAWQSLYHFSMGVPVEDPRLRTEPGYPWDTAD